MTKDNICVLKTRGYINVLEANRTRYSKLINFIKINKFPLIFIGIMSLLVFTDILLINKFFNLLVNLG